MPARFAVPSIRSVCLMVGALAVLVAASRIPIPRDAATSADDELMFFPSGAMLRPACAGCETMVADLCWLRAIQYYGQHRLTDRVYTRAGHIFRTVSRLDPEFLSNYIFGALVLAQDAASPREALALLTDGMEALPERWELPFEAGFVELVVCGMPGRAEPYFRRAAAYPSAPEVARNFAAWSALRAGDQRDAIVLWTEIARSADSSPALRAAAERYVKRLMAGRT